MYCSLCKSEIGKCEHNRYDMIIAVLDAWDKIKAIKDEYIKFRQVK